jgi:hypothetical protein
MRLVSTVAQMMARLSGRTRIILDMVRAWGLKRMTYLAHISVISAMLIMTLRLTLGFGMAQAQEMTLKLILLKIDGLLINGKSQ